jgi:PTS system nitrogen regulatory IIA component
MDIGSLLERGAVGARLSAATKRQALGAVAELAGRQLNIPPAQILEALTEREALGSTGVGQGIALPHARLAGLDRIHGVFVRLDQPVDFGAVDDQPVDLMFALLAPLDANTQHLRALARVSRLLRQADLRSQLRQARSPDTLYALLVRDTAQPSAA